MRFIQDLLLVYLYLLVAVRWYLFWKGSRVPAAAGRGDFLDLPIRFGLAVLLFTHFIGRIVYVPSRSMLDTLRVHDVLVVNALQYRLGEPERGDVAVFFEPGQRSTLVVKRIVAVGGDLVEVHGGRLFLQGEAQAEPYVTVPGKGPELSSHRVAPGAFFALGDNRGNSTDSRAFGDVPKGELVGKVALRLWPFSRAGRL